MKLSIITINYNNRDGLRKTIESVVNQTCRDFEYIVIDGGSTDGSVNVLKEYADRIDYWVSEPDKGIYNAMNKGIRAAHGEYCQFLNSGDTLLNNDIIEKCCTNLNDGIDIVCGYTKGKDKHGKLERNSVGSPSKCTATHLIQHYLHHSSSFIKRELLLKFPYDETLRIVSDWKFWLESIIFNNASYKHIDLDIVLFDYTGISSNQPKLVLKERQKTLNSILPLGYQRVNHY